MNSLRILIVVGSFLLSVVSVSAQSLVGKSWVPNMGILLLQDHM